jgi:shikimate dehydrogenase
MSPPDRYAVIGHPVTHSRSPFIHACFARQVGHDIEYSRIDASPEAFERTVAEFFAKGGKGLNVTLPHKESAVRLASDLTPRAARAGAVNTLSPLAQGGLMGDNTDGLGLIRDLVYNFGVAIAGRRVLLLGAGGAARGVLIPLLGLQPRELVIANRSPMRAVALAAQFEDGGNVRGCGFGDLAGEPYDVVINASAASLAGEVPALAPEVVEAHSFCYDMAYGKDDTAFVRWAKERGCVRTAMGLGMLVEQAAESFFIWRGIRPDTAPVLAALKVELTADS